jgi:hypothetical protein
MLSLFIILRVFPGQVHHMRRFEGLDLELEQAMEKGSQFFRRLADPGGRHDAPAPGDELPQHQSGDTDPLFRHLLADQ